MFSIKIEPTLQSVWGMGVGGSSMQLGFIMTPAGACYVEDESLTCIINRKTLITLKNKDDNGCWFSLLASYNIGNRTTRVKL